MDRCPTPLEVRRMAARVRARARALAPMTESTYRFIMGMGGFGQAGPPPGFLPPAPPAAGASVNRIRQRTAAGDVVPVRIEQCSGMSVLADDPERAAANRAILARAWLAELP
jgi:hypothetical protein